MSDHMPDIRADMDQIGAILRDYAPVVKTFYDSLVEQGFTQQEAYGLVQTWMTTQFSS